MSPSEMSGVLGFDVIQIEFIILSDGLKQPQKNAKEEDEGKYDSAEVVEGHQREEQGAPKESKQPPESQFYSAPYPSLL